MDQLSYSYQAGTNRLLRVSDAYGSAGVGDLPHQVDAINYEYDPIGNLLKDRSEGIDQISWTVYGKIWEIQKQGAGSAIKYRYDASGNRVYKEGSDGTKTFYVRDASGNTMAIYEKTGTGSLVLKEQELYGSSRLGIYQRNVEVENLGEQLIMGEGSYIWGSRFFELSNHLGNVLATLQDRMTVTNASGVDYFDPVVVSAQDYYAFGMMMPGRTYSEPSSSYRYGYNGKEEDDEVKGDGNQLDYGLRIYDPRLGKFLSIDPLTQTYPWWSPYQYAGNSPIAFIDLDGAELSKKLEEWGVKLTPVVAGFVDGLVDNISIVAMGSLLINLTDDEYRAEFFEAVKTAASDPVSFANMVAEDYKSKAKNIMAWNEEGQYEAGYVGGELVGGVLTGGAVAKLINYANKFKTLNKIVKKNDLPIKKKPCGCFTEGTLVLTSQGCKQIESIVVGDSVWAYSDSLHVLELQKVIHIFTQTFDQYFAVYFGGEKLEVTHEHPFYISGRWTKAQDLHTGDTLTTFDGRRLQIDSVRFIQSSKALTVYNFTVERYHTYYVSESNVLVHNGDPCDLTTFKFSKAKGFRDWFTKGLHGRTTNGIEIKYVLGEGGTITTALSQSNQGLQKGAIAAALKEGQANLKNIDFLKKSIEAINGTLSNSNATSFKNGAAKLVQMREALQAKLKALTETKN